MSTFTSETFAYQTKYYVRIIELDLSLGKKGEEEEKGPFVCVSQRRKAAIRPTMGHSLRTTKGGKFRSLHWEEHGAYLSLFLLPFFFYRLSLFLFLVHTQCVYFRVTFKAFQTHFALYA